MNDHSFIFGPFYGLTVCFFLVRFLCPFRLKAGATTIRDLCDRGVYIPGLIASGGFVLCSLYRGTFQ